VGFSMPQSNIVPEWGQKRLCQDIATYGVAEAARRRNLPKRVLMQAACGGELRHGSMALVLSSLLADQEEQSA
jgi:hypothetical protein